MVSRLRVVTRRDLIYGTRMRRITDESQRQGKRGKLKRTRARNLLERLRT